MKCFYRTYEGLKHSRAHRQALGLPSFYRTYEGLKLELDQRFSVNLNCFYRTYEGLKHNFRFHNKAWFFTFLSYL